MTRIGIVIVTWNQTELTLDCLQALEQAGVALADAWVIDNGSTPAALPRSFDAWVKKAMEKKADDRFASAALRRTMPFT